MRNSYKTLWGDMHQKTSYEFDTGKGQFFPLPFIPVIFHRKSDGFIIHTDDAMIANSNPMGVFSKIINHRLCTVKGFLTIRDPLRRVTGIKQFFECIMVTVFFGCSMKLKLVGLPKVFQFFHVFSAEYFGNDLDWKEKFSAVILPFIFWCQSSAKQYCVDMGMKVHFRTPCMQDADISNGSPKMLWVSSQFTDCSRSSVIQGVIQLLLITVNDWIQDIRNCKYEMKVRRIKYIFPAGIHPHFLWNSLAHGTTAVTTGVIMNLNGTTILTYADIRTISSGF